MHPKPTHHASHHGHDHDEEHTAHGLHGSHSHRLGAAFWIIGAFTCVEAVGGWWSGSLTLLADAGHLFVDTLALGLAYAAQRLALRPASSHRTFGHGRAGVLAAFVNSLVLLGIVAAIIIEAVLRLGDPHPIHAGIALAVAGTGVLVNLAMAFLLHADHGDMNVRAAYLHVLSDLLGAAAAAAAALIVMQTGWLAADAWLSLFVTVLIARSAWPLLVHSAHVLQEGAPAGFDVDHLATRLLTAVPGVLNIHHVHAWSLTPTEPLLTLHAQLSADANTGRVLAEMKSILVTEFSIHHSTIQIETEECADGPHQCNQAAVSLESL